MRSQTPCLEAQKSPRWAGWLVSHLLAAGAGGAAGAITTEGGGTLMMIGARSGAGGGVTTAFGIALFSTKVMIVRNSVIMTRPVPTIHFVCSVKPLCMS